MATDRIQASVGSARLDEVDRPSQAEVQRRVNALYDRAESDSGTFNATRAMSSVTRRGGGGRGAAEAALGTMARQWFDAARDRLGPTAPAVLPRDRMPERPASAPRPPQSADRSDGAGSDRTAVGGGRRPAELTSRTPAALPPAAEAPGTSSAAEASGVPLTAEAPGVPSDLALTAVYDRGRAAGAVPRPEPVSAPEAESAPSGAAPARRQDSLRSTKDRMGGKLMAARDLLASAATQPPAGATPAASAPATPAALTFPEPAPTATELSFPTPVLGEPGWDTGELPLYGGHGTSAWPMPDPVPGPTSPAVPVPDGFASPAPVASTASAPWSAAPLTDGVPPAPAPAASPGGGAPLAPTAQGGTAAFAATPQDGTSAPPSMPEDPGSRYALKAEKAVAFARAQIGKPCVWGAKGPGSYDCSGLTQAAWTAAGVPLPRSTAEQAQFGTPVEVTELRPGDLVFFFDGPHHTGLYAGNGTMIHAPGPGASVREESIYHAGQETIRGAIRPA
ncbi:NlpC/P60 family protein [Streptomyces sp. bgisy154]|uniref:C40 family peptidase n=1 Tax=Streptomyces sp. bgisy154 TaxID=3413794 RepID=UPI003D72F09E